MLQLPTVFLVDPDTRFIRSCRKLLEAHDVTVCSFDSPQEFFLRSSRTKLGCIVSELQFLGENGIDFSLRLKEDGWSIPLLIHTAFGDVASCSKAFRAGVSDFLEKTIPPDLLLERVLEIVNKSHEDHRLWLMKLSLTSKLSRLTDRESKVAQALVSGRTMKEIACDFGTSFQSVARHRQRILSKLQVENDVVLANLLRDYAWENRICEPEIDNNLPIVHH